MKVSYSCLPNIKIQQEGSDLCRQLPFILQLQRQVLLPPAWEVHHHKRCLPGHRYQAGPRNVHHICRTGQPIQIQVAVSQDQLQAREVQEQNQAQHLHLEPPGPGTSWGEHPPTTMQAVPAGNFFYSLSPRESRIKPTIEAIL